MNSALMLHRCARPAVAGSYIAGAVAGAATTAFGLLLVGGLLSPIPAAARATLALTALMLLFLRATGIACIDLPQRAYQIPRETFTTNHARSARRFAYELGLGFRTYVTSSSPYGLLAVVVLVPPVSLRAASLGAAMAALGFGLGRSVVVAAQALRSRVAVEPPARALKAADLVSLLAAAALATQAL